MRKAIFAMVLLCGPLGLMVGAQCPVLMTPNCDNSVNQNLYPESFMVFDAYVGKLYTVGDVVMLIAKFPDYTCNLPDPTTLGPDCRPTMLVSLFTENATCFHVTAASARQLEIVFGFSFADDPSLQTDSGVYNHWVFPLYVVAGMSTSRLDLKAFVIPEGCNSGRATFDNSDQISKPIHFAPSVKVDTIAPAIVSIHTGKAAGVYTAGDVINVVVEFSKDVELSPLPGKYSDLYMSSARPKSIPYGVPYLEMNSKALVPLRGYDESSQSKKRASFLYEVGAGEETPFGQQLDVVPGTVIELNGGAIVSSGTGLDVNMTTMPRQYGEGAMSYPTANKIYIVKTGEKFPPLRYDPSQIPDQVAYDGRRGLNGADYLRKKQKATMVSVDLQVHSIFDVDERGQRFRADYTLTVMWTDPRLKNAHMQPVTEYTTEIVDSNSIWSPKLTILNRREIGTMVEAGVNVMSSGKVVLVQRFVSSFGVDLDVRDFPFDVQHFVWQVRSSQYSRSEIRFALPTDEERHNMSQHLVDLPDPQFSFSEYTQATKTLITGAFKGFDVLSISIRAARLTSMNLMILVLPLCLLSAILVLLLQQDPIKDERITLPMAAIAVTMVFSFVVISTAPPVNYVTRIHLLIVHTYLFAVVELAANYYLRAICLARRELAEADEANKRIVKEARWMAKLVKPSPQRVVIASAGAADKHSEASDADKAAMVTPVSAAERALVCSSIKLTPLSESVVRMPSCKADASEEETAAAAAAALAAQDWEYGGAELRRASAISAPSYWEVPAAATTDRGAAALLDSDEVRAYKRLRWSGGPIPLFWGLARVSADNTGAWGDHAALVDRLLRMVLSLACVMSAASILGAEDLAMLGRPLLASEGMIQ